MTFQFKTGVLLGCLALPALLHAADEPVISNLAPLDKADCITQSVNDCIDATCLTSPDTDCQDKCQTTAADKCKDN